MISLLGALLTFAVAFGSALTVAGFVLVGLGTMSMGAIGLGLLFAVIQAAGNRGPRLDTREGLTLNQLHRYLQDAPNVTGDTKVYVGDQGINVAGAVFSCILDGHRTVVIERLAEQKSVAVPHDLF